MKKQIIIRGIDHLNELLNDSTKVLLVCDSSYPFLNIKDIIERMNVPHVVFDKFTPNPLYEDVCKGVDLFQITKCDTIVAVGGGSSIDVAKCIKLYCMMDKNKNYLEQEYIDTGVKLIAIPTTAGTGSESTRYAVIYYDGKKQSVTNESIIPNIAILEPSVLKTLPLYQKKCTMLDALCQGIESWWSVNSTEESKNISKNAVETIIKWWHEYIFENTSEAAEHILNAANLAGQAICITQTTAAHAMSYKITSMYKLPHGHAVAICLPEIWQFMLGNTQLCIDVRGRDYLVNIFDNIANTMGCSHAYEAILKIRLMMSEMEMIFPTAENKQKELDILTKSVNPIRLNNNPIKLDSSIIRHLYDEIIK